MTPERVIPLLVYRDIRSAYEFLINAFEFEPGFVHESPDGEAIHAEVHVGHTKIWLHRVTIEHALASPETVDMAGAGLVVHVPDVDAHYARAQASGARIDNEPIDRPYGQREYGARDMEGHRWWFATPIPVTQLS